MNGTGDMRIGYGDAAVHIDGCGNFLEITHAGKSVHFPLKRTLYEIDGDACDVSAAVVHDGILSLRLVTNRASGKLLVRSQSRGVRLSLEPESERAPENVGIVLPFPLEAKFHLPETYNLSRRIDHTMPVGECYTAQLDYNFFLVELNGLWIMLTSRQTRLGRSAVEISRNPELFLVTFVWKASDEVFVSLFPSMDDAMQDYEEWLRGLGVNGLKDDPSLPIWVNNVKLVIVVDMMRSNWEIAHDYDDVIRLAKDLRSVGAPEDTIVYIPGWNGAYDSTYPTYRPHAELGGDGKFKEMIETLHRCHLRVMIHTNAWGLDPYHKDIDKLLSYVARDEDGKFQGWQTGGRIWGGSYPLSRPLRFRSGKVEIRAPRGLKSFEFETTYVPDTCEALVKIGGLEIGGARCKVTIGRRSMLTPPGWFKEHDEYVFPFPFLLRTGVNRVSVEIPDECEPLWNGSWYEIYRCFIPKDPYASWTHPILLADVNNEDWVRIFVKEVAKTVRKYEVDAVHVDATPYDTARKLLDELRRELPDIPFGGETLETLWDLGFWTFCQNARQSLTGYLNVACGTCQQGSLPDRSRIDELYGWLDNPSPVRDFLNDYIRFYPHLCAADAFVPVGKVCNTFPSRLSPRSSDELWKTLRDARRLGYIPALRVNYREHGLDEQTRRAIRELGKR